jgi:hypothetical protein
MQEETTDTNAVETFPYIHVQEKRFTAAVTRLLLITSTSFQLKE